MKEVKKIKKGVIARLFEKGIEIFLRKECKTIKNININIFSGNSELIKGEISQLKITAEKVNYKELAFNKIELQASKLRINYLINNKKLNFKDSFPIQIKLSLTQESLQKIFNSQNWSWIGCLVSKEILDSSQLTDLKIENNIIELKGSNINNTNYKTALVKINSKDGKIHLKNINNMSSIIIPIDDKIYINHINIADNIITLSAQSEVSI